MSTPPRNRGDVIEAELRALAARVAKLEAALAKPADWADEPAEQAVPEAPAAPKAKRKSNQSADDPHFQQRVVKAFKAAVNANPTASDRAIIASLRGMGCDWLIRQTLRNAGIFIRRTRVRSTDELKSHVLDLFAKMRSERPNASIWDIATDLSKMDGMPSSSSIRRIVEAAGGM